MINEDKIRIALVVADFNKEITGVMLDVAKKRAEECAVTIAYIVHVPGVYDMPLAVKRLLQKHDVHGIVTLGVVISGGTAHDAHVADTTARLCADLSVAYEKPVALSVIGHDVSMQQALERKESYALHGIDAVVSLIKELRGLA